MARWISRTLWAIRVAMLLEIRFGYLVRERLASLHVIDALASGTQLAAPCKPAR